jgi:hypothetical protein
VLVVVVLVGAAPTESRKEEGERTVHTSALDDLNIHRSYKRYVCFSFYNFDVCSGRPEARRCMPFEASPAPQFLFALPSSLSWHAIIPIFMCFLFLTINIFAF